MLNIGFIVPYTENRPHYYYRELLDTFKDFDSMCSRLSFLDLRDLSVERLTRKQLFQAMKSGVNFVNLVGKDTITDFTGY